MHDINLIRNQPDLFKKKIEERNTNIDLQNLLNLDKKNRELIQNKEKFEQEKKIISKKKDKSQFSRSRDISKQIEKLSKEEYDSSNGRETFISFDDEDETIYGFLRLRKPSELVHRDEITSNSCIVRELHVFGKSIKIGEHEENSIQHSGLGKKLMDEAEKISKESFDAKKLLVISAVGTREYYKKLGYSLDGPYMSKQLR